MLKIPWERKRFYPDGVRLPSRENRRTWPGSDRRVPRTLFLARGKLFRLSNGPGAALIAADADVRIVVLSEPPIMSEEDH